MKVEELPKNLLVDQDGKGGFYQLRMHVTADNKLCLCYSKITSIALDKDRLILSQVVEPEMAAKPEFSECIYDIVDVPTFDKAVEMLKKRVNEALASNEVSIPF